MSEADPSLPLEINQQPFEATRHNTTIFTFWGRLAMYNHAFVQVDAKDTTLVGAYIFNDHPVFGYIAEHAIENSWPMILNRNDVPDCDVTAWDNAHLGDLRGLESFPEDWDGAA